MKDVFLAFLAALTLIFFMMGRPIIRLYLKKPTETKVQVSHIVVTFALLGLTFGAARLPDFGRGK